MNRCVRALRCFSSKSSITGPKANWDPIVSLELKHPSLVLLEKCSSRNHLKQILAQMMRADLICQTFPMSRLIFFSAVSHPENMDIALILFHHFTPFPNLFIFNTMISALSFSSSESFCVYSCMLGSCVYPDKHTLLYLLQASKRLFEVKQVHCHAVVTGLFLSHGYLQNSLMKMYLESGEMDLANKVFVSMPEPDSASFNIMIGYHAKRDDCVEALKLFHQMLALDLEPDEFTMLGLIVSSGQLGDVQLGKSVHAWMERRKHITSLNSILCNALLDMYVKCNELKLARRVFDGLTVKDVVSWNTVIAGLAKAGKMETARAFFDQMPSRDIVSWNSLIAGYVQRGDYGMGRLLLNDMVAENVRPDHVTMINLVSVAAEIRALDIGRWIHGLVIRLQMEMDAFLSSALIDMYCKCGSIERALEVFREASDKDVTVWTAMITGFAFHGYGRKAVELFYQMQEELMPNEVTLLAVLTACSHSGLVDVGLKIFYGMERDYGIEPGVEHHGCLVDLLCRSGRLDKAKDAIDRMPMKPSRSIWGSMLNASRAHGEVEMAETASAELLKLEPDKEGGYILLSNTYAASGRWSYADKIREVMENRGLKKIAGCSSVAVDGIVHDFVAADKKHARWVAIVAILSSLHGEMKLRAHISFDCL
ncbi:hypothetical protein SLA2020_459190 [Shorea laevis]